MGAALEVTGIWPIREYVRRWKAKIVEYVAWKPKYEICKNIESM